jgi:hypothetical protein
MWLPDEAGFSRELRESTHWTALLRCIGCTGHAHEIAMLFGDEIMIRARTLIHDAANPEEVTRDVVEFSTAGRRLEEREQIILITCICLKTIDHRIRDVYRQIGVSTRGAASLWATQNRVVA